MIENLDNKNIQSFEYETSINSDGNIAGTCELGNATIQMLNDSNEYSSLKGQWIKTIHGSFYIHSVEPVQEKVNIKLSCYDVKYKLDIPYDSSLYSWPMTLKEWRNQIGNNCGITFDNSDFPNSDLILNEEPYIGEKPSNRTVISIIAQAGCSWVDTDKDDIFYFNWFDNTIHIVNDWIELTTEKEMSYPINVAVLGRGDVEDNVKWPEILPENPVEFRIDNNYILDPQEAAEDKRYDVIETIYNRVNGFKYLVFNIRAQDILNKLSIKLGQIVVYRDMWGNVLSANIMSKRITYLGGNLEDDDNYEITLSAEEMKETSTEYSYASSIENKLRKTEIAVDKQKQRIEAIASDVNTNKEKVASLEITTGNISTKVSSVEKNLSTTNSNLSNLSNTVDTLSNDIDGVSADFEDFKDNEYIQSIDNLQKQIDGAIQFWNGAEIPTLNNYPANEWTTENDKINHQADIYTVVQDVEGEMKQGKSYRFDKIDDVWQWIELTDNELSAVQAIAQESLDKAKANATEIGTIKTNVSQLQQADEQIKASVESIDKQIIPTATSTGSNIYVEDASDDPLIQLEIEGKSTQKVVTDQNICPTDFSDWESGHYNTNGVKTDYPTRLRTINLIPVTPNTTYYAKTDLYNFIIRQFNANEEHVSSIGGIDSLNGVTFTTSDNVYYIGISLYEGTDYATFETNWNDVNPYICLGEEYIPIQPSPDYPSEIESVGYKNVYNDDNRLLGTINSDGDLVIPYSTQKFYEYDFKENTQYTISAIVKNINSGGNARLRVIYTDGTITDNVLRNDTTEYKYMTFTSAAGKTIDYIGTTYGSSMTDTGNPTALYIQNAELMIVEGIKSHSYIPYGKYGIEVVNTGKNKADIYNNITEQYTLGSTGLLSVNANYFTTDFIKIKPNTTYTESMINHYTSATAIRCCCYDKDGNFISLLFYLNRTETKKYSITFTTPDNAKYIRMSFRNTDTEIQLEQGDTATVYEEFQKNKALFVLNEPPRSLPNGIADKVYVKNNMLYVDRYVGSIVLDGSENWEIKNQIHEYSIIKTFLPNQNIPAGSLNILSNYFNACINVTSEIGQFRSGGSYINFNFDNGLNGLDNFKTWLSTHNMQLDYELAEPYTEVIGEIEMPSTFKGITYITTTDDLEPTINIEYVRDTVLSKYVEGQIDNLKTIEERHYADLSIQNDNIKASVSETQTSLDGAISNMDKLESTMTSQSATLEVISKNIDTTTGEVREVTTTTGFTFNAEGSSIKDSEGYEIKQTPKGAYYKDGDKITGQYTKDGSKQKDLELFGTYSYGKDNIDDTPMFVAQLYTDENGEECFGHFYNGGDY